MSIKILDIKEGHTIYSVGRVGHIVITYGEAVLYRLKDKTKPSKYLRNYQETGSIPKSYMPKPFGHKDAAIAPVDMENGGHHPNWQPKRKK